VICCHVDVVVCGIWASSIPCRYVVDSFELILCVEKCDKGCCCDMFSFSETLPSPGVLCVEMEYCYDCQNNLCICSGVAMEC
jgi:hypothetical protein